MIVYGRRNEQDTLARLPSEAVSIVQADGRFGVAITLEKIPADVRELLVFPPLVPLVPWPPNPDDTPTDTWPRPAKVPPHEAPTPPDGTIRPEDPTPPTGRWPIDVGQEPD